jgi:hypothetical protein
MEIDSLSCCLDYIMFARKMSLHVLGSSGHHHVLFKVKVKKKSKAIPVTGRGGL